MVAFVIPGSETPYGDTIAAFEAAVEERCASDGALCAGTPIETRTYLLGRDNLAGLDADGTLVIPLGAEAARAVAGLGAATRTIYALIPSNSYSGLLECCIPPSASQSAIFLDQPPQRILDLAQEVLPDARHIGLLTSEETASLTDPFQRLAHNRGLRLISAQAEDSDAVGPALKTMFGVADFLIALPDATLYNSQTVYGVLLSTYRERMPVIGFSRSLVKAGALVAVYTSPEDAGKELASVVWDQGSEATLNPPSYPKYFTITVNDQVGRSLGISLPPAEELVDRLERKR